MREEVFQQEPELDTPEMLCVIADIVGSSVSNYLWVDEYSQDSFDDSENANRYTVEGNTIYRQPLNKNSKPVGKRKSTELRKFLWKELGLQRVCAQYQDSYRKWMNDNGKVGYIHSRITSDDDLEWGENTQRTHRERIKNFIDQFLSKDSKGLKLLTAEYGKGKSSFCQWFRSYVGDECDRGNMDRAFMDGERAFPFFFNLNDFRDGDFDVFLENRLKRYNVHLNYSTFELLCRKGIFCVVLDAWDQMHGAPISRQTFRDIEQFSALWRDKGRILITCRRTFYLQQLNMKRKSVGNSSIHNAMLFNLHGFDREGARQYLEETRQKANTGMPDLKEWFDEAWRINEALLSRPLNLHLVAKHYKNLVKNFDITKKKIESDDLFKVLLDSWKDKYQGSVSADKALKKLTVLTLRAGLNRGVDLERYKEEMEQSWENTISVKDWNTLKWELEQLDFLMLSKNRQDSKNGNIEFRLAAYQEFLWANYVLNELENDERCDISSLIGSYLLTPEARAWVVKRLLTKTSDCLTKQIALLAYKKREETGCTGGNVLTLLGDLTRGDGSPSVVEYYVNQLQKTTLTDRAFCGADLHGLNLDSLKFSRCDLSDSNFSYSSLEETDFQYAKVHNTRWDEYGPMTKCAFLVGDRPEAVVAATDTGGLLTYNLSKRISKMTPLSDSVIQDISADSRGVYTADKDGQVCYLSKDGMLRNIFVTSDALQAIATAEEDKVYVAAEENGLYRFDRRTMNRKKIVVTGIKGEDITIEKPEHICFCVYENNRYIAFLTMNNSCLMLLQLFENNVAECLGIGSLNNSGLSFGDICFAGDKLVYQVREKGVFSKDIKLFIDELDRVSLINDTSLVKQVEESVQIAWAGTMKRLLILGTGENGGESICVIDVNDPANTNQTRELEWLFQKQNYKLENISDFATSADGKYLAVVGERLAVFKWDGYLYQLDREPLESRLKCIGANFNYSEGLTINQIMELLDRGAIIEI